MTMKESCKNRYLQLSSQAQAKLINGARDDEPVKGLTHGFYKYPARFSPQFARAAIETFTKPGELVLDPHVGGGTTLVEALALGRDAVGVDISAACGIRHQGEDAPFTRERELETLDCLGEAHAGAAIDIHGSVDFTSPTTLSLAITSISIIRRVGACGRR